MKKKERYVPSVYEMMHDLPVKIYEEGRVGEYFCHCSKCHINFIGHKTDPVCGSCEAVFPDTVTV